MSEAGASYRVANGHRVPNIGQQAVHFCTDEGQAAGMMFQTLDIERPLISASQLVAVGNQVTISEKGAAIVQGGSGKRTRLYKRCGLYILCMWIPTDPPGPGFARQGQK